MTIEQEFFGESFSSSASWHESRVVAWVIVAEHFCDVSYKVVLYHLKDFLWNTKSSISHALLLLRSSCLNYGVEKWSPGSMMNCVLLILSVVLHPVTPGYKFLV